MDKPQSIVDHLTELRKRIIYAGLSLLMGVIIVLIFSQQLFNYIMSTAGKDVVLVQIHFSDAFMAQFQLAMIGGIVLAAPFVLYQLVAFIMPALRPNERRLLYIGLPAATGLFVLGWSFGWFVVVPISKSFFGDIAAQANVQNQITPSNYISFVLGICNPLGIAFELPLVVLILAKIGLVSARFLARIRKYAFLGIMILAAVLSPPDVVSMVIFLVPLYGLYEVSILMAHIAGKKK